MTATQRAPSPTMATGFAGGTPELWDPCYPPGIALVPDRTYFRSAPARAIRAALLGHLAAVSGGKALELGCGGSRWLPLLCRNSGFEAWGVDFSESGVESARRALRRAGAFDGNVTVGEVRAFARRHQGMFDAVLSFGLIEHFSDLGEILEAHVRCARAGGRLFVTAPNLTALNLRWARAVAPDIFSWHRPICAEEVARILEGLGCTDVQHQHLGGPRLLVAPTPGSLGGPFVSALAAFACQVLNGTGELFYRLSPTLATTIAGSRLSPHFAVSAIAPAG